MLCAIFLFLQMWCCLLICVHFVLWHFQLRLRRRRQTKGAARQGTALRLQLQQTQQRARQGQVTIVFVLPTACFSVVVRHSFVNIVFKKEEMPLTCDMAYFYFAYFSINIMGLALKQSLYWIISKIFPWCGKYVVTWPPLLSVRSYSNALLFSVIAHMTVC